MRSWLETTRRLVGRGPASRAGLAVALQGGGSHGAFTWGVLDRLLAHQGPAISAASGASAGALNAVALAAGLLEGGPEGARAMLQALWRGVADATPSGWRTMVDFWAPALKMFSPYGFNPHAGNPLREVLGDLIDFERLRAERPLNLVIAATHVATGRARLFDEADVTLDAVLASTCLPWLQQAVIIDGDAYWDGGLSANPPLLGLIDRTACRDLLLVTLVPEERLDLPVTAAAIGDRFGELAFTAPLVAELAALDRAKAMAGSGISLDPMKRRYAALRLHRLTDPDLADLSASSRLDADWRFLSRLSAMGHEAAECWLAGLVPPANENLEAEEAATAWTSSSSSS